MNMSIFERAGGCSRSWFSRHMLALLVPSVLLFGTWPQNLLAYQEGQAPAGTPPPPYLQQTPEQLQQLVAPIALYPDSLVAQILAASTFPDQIVLADRWVQANPELKGSALAQAANQQPWDPSVKALTAFPSVLGNMDKNLSWTSSLGDAYYNQQPDVMNAVQVMRQRAQAAGNLQTTPQQTVETQDSTISIQPAGPDLVYVPAYDPWVVYGAPILAWPGWYPYPGIWFGGPYLQFGIGFEIGFFGGFGWGWGHWGFDWHHRYPVYNHERYYSRSNTFYNRTNYYRAGGERGVEANVQRGVNVNRGGGGSAERAQRPGGVYNSPGRPGAERPGAQRPGGVYNSPGRPGAERPGAERPGAERPGGVYNSPGRPGAERPGGVYNSPGAVAHPFSGNTQAARGYAEPRGESGVRSNAFSNYDHGGQARSFSSRGSSSLGGGHVGGGPAGGAHGGSHGGGGKPR